MPRLRKNPTEKTRKVVCILSYNRCAYPECLNELVEPATEQSDIYLSAQICHIYSDSARGPRGNPQITENEFNAPDNLIVLCRHHHGIIDGQPESYPADVLKEWKQTHEAKMRKLVSANLENIPLEVFSHSDFPIDLIDQKIKEDVDIIRKTRFFREIDVVNNVLVLGEGIKEKLRAGTDTVRSHALAWCARLLAHKKVETAREYLNLAKQLGTSPEINIAEAFIASYADDKKTALDILDTINSPSSRSAKFLVVAHNGGAESAIDWSKKEGINPDDMDSEGKFSLLNCQLELTRREAAEETVSTLSEHDFASTPALYHSVAITYLLKAVPADFCALVLNQLPLYLRSFPLAADAPAMDAREKAFHYFSKAVNIERQLGCARIASLDDEYALWLQLRNPETTDVGRERLKEKLRDLSSALQLVPFALQFEIDLDITAVEQEIERTRSPDGEMTPESAIARLALVLTRKPKDVANYVERHHDELSKFIGKKQVDILRIEAFSHAGMLDEAEQHLLLLSEDEFSEEDKARLRRMILEASGADPVEIRKEQFNQTNALSDLAILVDKLHEQQNWPELCKFGNKLFQRTRSVVDAERLAVALNNTRKSKELIQFLEDIPSILQQSKHLQMAYCWALYHEGRFSEAQTKLTKIGDPPDGWDYPALSVNLGLALGDWSSLSAYVASEYQARDNRDASQIMQTARLAHHIGSPLAKDLMFVAATKGVDDPEILANAYNLAQTADWKEDETITQYFQRAVELSGDSGSIRRITLEELDKMKTEWDRHEFKIWQMLSRGDIPMFLAGEVLNRTLASFMLFPALANLSESDLRRRGAVPSYSGNRASLPKDIAITRIGIDASALLTLGFLDILNVTFNAFDTIYVPHSTINWLIGEKQKISFHQPSRIRDASRVRDMLATDILERFVSSTVADSDLSAHVGSNLAMLIAEAEKARENDETQHIVVSPSPVYRLGSLMGEEANLTKHAGVLSSCLAVINKLRRRSQITIEEERAARDYLLSHEKPWPQQPDISDNAVLYLDDLAIKYFLNLGVLDKLKAAGFTAIVSPSEVSESNALISYEYNAGEISEIIERILTTIKSHVEKKQIIFGRQPTSNQTEEKHITDHPTIDTTALAEVCDAIIIDDRFINQHAKIGDTGVEAVIFSTLDILDRLVSDGVITSEQNMEYRTQLRRAGYFFIPVREDELIQHLSACVVVEGEIEEKIELKAIRENLLRIRMSDWIQLPKEMFWLETTIKSFIIALKKFWISDTDISKVMVISEWIVKQIDVRGWAHCLNDEGVDDFIKTGRGAYILLLLTSPPDASSDIKKAYWEWVEGRILVQIRDEFPDLYNWIVNQLKQHISDVADMDLAGIDLNKGNTV